MNGRIVHIVQCRVEAGYTYASAGSCLRSFSLNNAYCSNTAVGMGQLQFRTRPQNSGATSPSQCWHRSPCASHATVGFAQLPKCSGFCTIQLSLPLQATYTRCAFAGALGTRRRRRPPSVAPATGMPAGAHGLGRGRPPGWAHGCGARGGGGGRETLRPRPATHARRGRGARARSSPSSSSSSLNRYPRRQLLCMCRFGAPGARASDLSCVD
eukprot:COSAG02_NODE_5409_length_4352_cov_3.033153_7_plen_212_part_00